MSTCTPTTSISGRADFIAMAMPLARPPPPTGTTTFARSGTSSSSSSPSVPCPATTSGSSKGCTKAMPASCARARAAATHSSTLVPPRWTIAPSAPHPSALDSGASTGMKTSHGTPRALAAWASAQAWLPALPPVTPWAQPSPRAASLFRAPRILNEPVRCRFSAFSATTPSRRWVSVREGSTGVRLATSTIAPRARSMSSGVTVARVGEVAMRPPARSPARRSRRSRPSRPAAARPRRSCCAPAAPRRRSRRRPR